MFTYILAIPLAIYFMYLFAKFFNWLDSKSNTGSGYVDYDVIDDLYDDNDDNWTKLDLEITKTRELLLRLKLEADKDLDNPTIYKRSIIVDKKLFSKIINGHIPSKHSVMALGLALELDLEDYQLLLATANFALNPADMFDTVVKYCVTQRMFDVMQVDSLLFQMDLPCFIEQ